MKTRSELLFGWLPRLGRNCLHFALGYFLLIRLPAGYPNAVCFWLLLTGVLAMFGVRWLRWANGLK